MTKEITLEAKIENIETVTEFVNEILETADAPMKAVMQIDLALDEVFTNIASYAYQEGTGNATVEAELTENPRSVRITFADSGKPFDPLMHEDPDTTLSLDERKIGGLGIFLVKKTMDDVRYEYKDGQNRLTIRKNLE